MAFTNNAIFWIEVEKISPNPYQPRREFDQDKLKGLAESIRQYGVLQPLVVTQKEIHRDDGGMSVQYELIAGERRLRASKIAGLSMVPVIIKDGHENEQMKLELAIIENLQREDISPLERARAFHQLASQFNLKHGEIAQKVGKSREYVSNTIRLLQLPPDMLAALGEGKISEGHARPLLMLTDRPEEQQVLFKEIIYKRITVREAEQISRRIALDRVRKKERTYDQEIVDLEVRASETLGTRVRVEPRDVGGKVMIDFMSEEDLRKILRLLNGEEAPAATEETAVTPTETASQSDAPVSPSEPEVNPDDELYSITNFSV